MFAAFLPQVLMLKALLLLVKPQLLLFFSQNFWNQHPCEASLHCRRTMRNLPGVWKLLTVNHYWGYILYIGFTIDVLKCVLQL